MGWDGVLVFDFGVVGFLAGAGRSTMEGGVKLN